MADNADNKTSSQLLAQIELRRAQIANPTPERLRTMQGMGMNVDNLQIQRIFIHLNSELTTAQTQELNTIGITLYQDSWIPPVGANPTGFLLADMPIDKLGELAAKDYIIKLETAERQLEPQKQFKPQ